MRTCHQSYDLQNMLMSAYMGEEIEFDHIRYLRVPGGWLVGDRGFVPLPIGVSTAPSGTREGKEVP